MKSAVVLNGIIFGDRFQAGGWARGCIGHRLRGPVGVGASGTRLFPSSVVIIVDLIVERKGDVLHDEFAEKVEMLGERDTGIVRQDFADRGDSAWCENTDRELGESCTGFCRRGLRGGRRRVGHCSRFGMRMTGTGGGRLAGDCVLVKVRAACEAGTATWNKISNSKQGTKHKYMSTSTRGHGQTETAHWLWRVDPRSLTNVLTLSLQNRWAEEEILESFRKETRLGAAVCTRNARAAWRGNAGRWSCDPHIVIDLIRPRPH